MENRTDLLPVVLYRRGISAEAFEEFLWEASQGVQDGVDNVLTSYQSEELAKDVGSYHWQSLWKLMLDFFGCSPWDLATWGLRFSSGDKPIIIRELNLLLTHPIWEGDVDTLRYVLQKTIIYRVGAYIEPWGPLTPIIADNLIAEKKPDASDMALKMWARTNPIINLNVMRLLDLLLERTGNINRQSWSRWSGKPFLLKPVDVFNIHDSLDILSRNDLARFSVQEYYNAYVKQHMWPHRLATVDSKTVERWDKAILAIKKRDDRLGEPDTRVGKEREQHKTLAYWESPNCDPRLKKLISKNSAPYIFAG